MSDVPAAVRAYVLDEHGDIIEAVLSCADAIAEGWDGNETVDRTDVVGPLEAMLDRTGVLDQFPGVITGAVEAAGYELRATPVAGPPYVAVTGVGPVLRATVPDGRLVLTIRAFAIERDPVRYVRGPARPAEALEAEFRSR